MLETPYAVAFISRNIPLPDRAPAKKLNPDTKSVSLKSKRFPSSLVVHLVTEVEAAMTQREFGPAP